MFFHTQHERFIVNGSHDAEKLQDLLDGFIRKYVLCPECDNPETDLKVQTKKGTISQSCKACGFHGPLEVHHKVTDDTYSFFIRRWKNHSFLNEIFD